MSPVLFGQFGPLSLAKHHLHTHTAGSFSVSPPLWLPRGWVSILVQHPSHVLVVGSSSPLWSSRGQDSASTSTAHKTMAWLCHSIVALLIQGFSRTSRSGIWPLDLQVDLPPPNSPSGYTTGATGASSWHDPIRALDNWSALSKMSSQTGQT